MDKITMLKKMNIRLHQEFYELIKYRSDLEHIPPSTFVRKYLMDNLFKDLVKDEKE